MFRPLSLRCVRLAAVLASSTLLPLLAPACGSDAANGKACSPSDFVPCTCQNGASGLSRCNAAGTGYDSCTCSDGGPMGTPEGGKISGDGGARDGATAGSLPFLSPCTTNAECASNDCYPFNMKGPHCTKSCSADGDCPSPSPGCSPVGICRVPP